MFGAWKQFGPVTGPVVPSDETTFKIAEDYLAGLDVEDWGCGAGWFKMIHRGGYVGVDGSKTAATDVVADLAEYRSNVEGIFIRHVLEHNDLGWAKILTNAMMSARRRLVLVLFTPFSEVGYTDVLGWSGTSPPIPDLSLCRDAIVQHFDGLPFQSIENLKTNTQYGVEHVFIVETGDGK